MFFRGLFKFLAEYETKFGESFELDLKRRNVTEDGMLLRVNERKSIKLTANIR